jgi:hypothetical protein
MHASIHTLVLALFGLYKLLQFHNALVQLVCFL